MNNKTTHELARELLKLPDMEVVHHYYFHEDFRDDGLNWYSEVELLREGDKYLITTGDMIDG